VLNVLFLILLVLSLATAALTGGMQALTTAIVESAAGAVRLAIGLIGVMALFLGAMQVAEDGGLLRLLARAVGPVLRRLFPTVPADHPAMSAMLLNICANMLGLGNAATPFGIRAMQELDKLNTRPGTITNAMVTFLAINTSGLALLPSGTVSIRAAAGSANPAGILVTSWFATGVATLVAVTGALLLGRFGPWRKDAPDAAVSAEPEAEAGGAEDLEQGLADLESDVGERRGAAPRLGVPVSAAAVAVLVLALAAWLFHPWPWPGTRDRVMDVASFWLLPLLLVGLVLFGWARGVKVYESLVHGARQGFNVAVRILPYLVAILVAIGMFRASGGLGAVIAALDPLTSRIGLPAEALPMALIRPLSGGAAMGVMSEILNNPAIGPDSLVGYLVSTIQGSTETTFYVLAVYCGAVGVRRTRHAVPACLAADVAGIAAAVFIVRLLFG
jgi:spore maturation protein SpmA